VEERIEGASMTRIAQDTGLSISYVSRLLKAKDRNPTLSNAAKVAKALGVPLEALHRHLEPGSAAVN
jgi:transcriptional regulator with XRE-family HTH domain